MKGLTLISVLLILTVTDAANKLSKLGSFPLKQAAFSQIFENKDAKTPAEKYNLIISTFGPPSLFSSASDSVTMVRRIGTHFDDIPAIRPEVITTDTVWPNEVSKVPDGIFPEELIVIPDGFLVPFKTKGNIKFMDITEGKMDGPFTITEADSADGIFPEELIVIPDGFLVPFKTKGNIKFMDITEGKMDGPFTITEADSAGSWFYHRVEWHDMDGDGDQDIITCRAREPVVPVLFGREDEELVWLENPSGAYKMKWNTHVLAHGPDSFFRYGELNTSDGMKECIFAAQFFTKSLSVYWTSQANGLFTDSKMMQKRVIDDNIGSVFEVDIVDLNNDGRMDLLVTTNGGNGTLLAYEIPDDFRTGKFIKHTIAVGFTPAKSGTGKGAPGSAIAVYPKTVHNKTKPVIIMSGDDDGKAYTFEASSEDPSDWSYVKTPFCEPGDGTVGEISAADVNGDGYLDVFVPSYSTNEVFVYSYAPSVRMDTVVG